MAGLYNNSLLATLLTSSPSSASSNSLGEATRRKVFFSFHYDDVFRVNNVRNAWKIDHPDSQQNRSFCDSSLWESKKAEGEESIKRLIREGVEYTSAVCVLIGAHTWSRRWVRYEIARAIIDRKGLLAVHINGLSHHERRTADTLGRNPLDYMAIGPGNDGKQYLYEKQLNTFNLLTGSDEGPWVRYKDYTNPVFLPHWLPSAAVGYVTPLSAGALTYNFVTEQGHRDIGSWIDAAAQKAGR